MGIDVRESRLDEILQLIDSYSKTYSRTIKHQLGCDLEDFVQTVVTNIFRRKGLDNYDEEKNPGGFASLIFRFCKNEIIDMQRKKGGTKTRTDMQGRPFQFLSLQEELGSNDEGESFTLLDVLAADPGMEMLLLELLETIPDEQISPNYNLSWRQLFKESNESTPLEIAQRRGISESRITQLQTEMFRRWISIELKEKKGSPLPKIEEPLVEKTYVDYLIEKNRKN